MKKLFKVVKNEEVLENIKEFLEENYIEDPDDEESGFYFNVIGLTKEGFKFIIGEKMFEEILENYEGKFKHPKYLVNCTEYGSGFHWFVNDEFETDEILDEIIGMGESGPAYNDSDCEEGHKGAREWIDSLVNELNDKYETDGLTKESMLFL